MDEIQIFTSKLIGSIRFVEKNGKPYAVASDVAKVLGYKDTINAIKQHCRWVVKHHIPHPQSKNKTLEVNVIPQGDIVRLVTNSELPGAEKVESWIFDEVVPTILNHGIYVTDEAYQEYLTDKPKFELRLKVAHEEIEALRLDNEELEQANELLTNNYNDVKIMWNNCTNDIIEFVQSQLLYKKSSKIRCVDLYNSYHRWSVNNQHSVPRTQKIFDEEIKYWRVQDHPIVKEGNYYVGIEVKKK